MNHRLSLLPLLLPAALGVAQDGAQEPRPDGFMAQANALSPEFARAVARARVHNKRLLVLFPRDGQDLAADLKKDRTLSRKLYEVEMVQLTGEAAPKMAACWGVGDDRPAAVMLSDRGVILARLQTDDLIVDGEIAGAKLLAKIEPGFCKPVDAQKKLDDALALAKKSGRHVFVRFDAPW